MPAPASLQVFVSNNSTTKFAGFSKGMFAEVPWLYRFHAADFIAAALFQFLRAAALQRAQCLSTLGLPAPYSVEHYTN